MESCLIKNMRKLAIWHTKTFKPILTHEELDPIMSTLGFLAQPEKPSLNDVVWKEYLYTGQCCRSLLTSLPLPTPRLPSHRINGRLRIDGLHVYTYRAFIDAVNFYLGMDCVSNLFHIRGMPLQPISDRNKRFRRMNENASTFVYKDGTLDQLSYNLYHVEEGNNVSSSNGEHSSTNLRDKGSNMSIGIVVPLKEIIVLQDINIY